MAIQRVTPDDFETFTLETNPRRTYISSSIDGVTGSVNLYSRRSSSFKELYPLALFRSTSFTDQNVDNLRRNAIIAATSGSTNIEGNVLSYMSGVTAQGESARLNQKLEIIRFTPPFRFNSNTGRKLAVINSLMPYYRMKYPTANFAYTNYHCLNFFSGSDLPEQSVLLYPNPFRTANANITDYGLSGSFTFDFWIRPKYSDTNGYYKPGTIFHLTNSYAISLVSGSSRDINGALNGFRILLQLTGSTNLAPDAVSDTMPFVFLSPDNSIPRDEWSHVTIRWGGPNYNYGTGSFAVNGVEKSYFTITESLPLGVTGAGTVPDPNVLAIGNYYQGMNSGIRSLSWFFSQQVSDREGLYTLTSSYTQDVPTIFNFKYPLRAEVHDLKIYERYLNINEVRYLQNNGPKFDPSLLFYLPPFFTYESPYRTTGSIYGVLQEGGVPITPFFSVNGTTTTPFAIDMAFGCGGHFINLENYVRDFATGRYPRLFDLTCSYINETTPVALTANNFLYASSSFTGSNVKRLYSILPNDNGNYYPNFQWLANLSSSNFVDDLGLNSLGLITLRNLITGAFPADVIAESQNAISRDLEGGNDPINFGNVPGTALTIYNRTRDGTSNQVVFFDISNMFYGNRINPGTFVITDTNLSASKGNVSIKIKDDGNGNLYRADASGSHATWSSVGNIFYDEGIILIKSPHLYFFGENQFECEFEGVQNIHVLTVNGYARPLQLISSSYAGYQSGSIDDISNNTDDNYVFLSQVLLHDDNLNVIGRTSIAQPVLKRSGDKFMFKIKMDF